MKLRLFGSALLLGAAVLLPTEGKAQTTESQQAPEGTSPPADAPQAAPPAEPETPAAQAKPETQDEVPPVEVVQPKPKPKPVVEAKPKPKPKPKPRPVPQPVVQAPPPLPAEPTPIEPELVLPSLITQPAPGYYGPPGGQAAHERATNSAQSPINPVDGIVPGNLQDFSSAASRVTREQIDELEPLTTNDILQRVPGVAIINDDGLARHGGISIRGAPARRSRKVLVLEDGRPINMSLWLDPSTHYVPPPDRIESVEVLRGSVIYAPNNNFGAVNFRNLQPFGLNETVISGSGGSVALSGGTGEERSVKLDDSSAATWHVHTRQNANANGNQWGTVLSYSGANVQGAWDTERLRYNDFYTALGWAGVKSDLTLSAVYFRQRDDYDESNFEGEEDDEPGEVESQFFKDIKHCKTCFNLGSMFNTYNADVVLLQGVYNYYFDADTTLNYRVYGQHHRRDRYQNFEGANPVDAETNFAPIFVGDDVFIPEGVMLGRLRTYNFVGTELRTEFANRPFLFGFTQDIEVGARYEHHDFTNRNFFGRQGQILKDGSTRGVTVFDRDSEADAFSAFLQTSIPVTQGLAIVPGVRVDTYHISRDTKALSEEEGEGEELDPCVADGTELFDGEECVEFEVDRDPFSEAFTKTHVLPGIGFSWGFGQKITPADLGSKSLKPIKPTHTTTVYGGYNRGLTMGVLREAAFPPDDELGNNYQIGVRSVALKGITFDVAGFHKQIVNFQIKGASTDASGNNVYTNIDEVEINGFEAYTRLDTRPFTGWTLNPYAEGSFTLSDGVITEGIDEEGVSLVDNLIPEAPREVAYLTAGIESTAGWNASVSWIYRGAFFTDEQNTPFGADPSGEDGEVPSVWLLAARANYTIALNGAEAVLFVSGENLTDELYIVDREDGIKPGLGRTIMAGAKFKW